MIKFRKTYKFAFISALLLSILVIVLVIVLHLVFYDIPLNIYFLIILGILLFTFSFLIIQYRVEQFIYRRIQKIYKDVSILDIEEIDKNTVTTNMETLSKTVKKFAENKRVEIESLKEREDYRREFLGNISHELKTPLFTVQGYLLTLLEGAIDDKEIRLKYLERANKGVERLNHIVKDLDMISKLESGDLNLKVSNFNILKLVDDVFDLLEMRAKKRSISLRFDQVYETPIFVLADRDRIQQVLINLIANAIHYGKSEGVTVVNIKPFSKSKVMISIKDDGDGIKPEYLPRLFERFYRVDKSRSRNQGGSGLGLSIVKHIIEAHHEEIFVESELSKGSTFSFTLENV